MLSISEALALLGHFDQYVRENGMAALRHLGTAALPDLVAALETQPPAVAGQVALVLGQIGDDRALRPLGCRLIDLPPGEPRTLCVRGLTDLVGPQHGDQEWLLELLVRLTRDEDFFVRALACTGLARLEAPEALPFLDRACSDPDEWVRESAANALQALKLAIDRRAAPPEQTEIQPPSDDGQPSDDPATESAPEGGDRSASGQADANDTTSGRNRIESLLRRAFTGDSVGRELAAESLAKLGEAALPALLAALPPASSDVPLQVVSLLGRLGSPQAVPALLDIARASGDPDLRTVAIRSLGQVCRGTEGDVLDFLVGHRSTETLCRAAVANALGCFRSIRAAHALLGHLDAPSPLVREEAAAALGRAAVAGTPDLGARLTARLRAERDDRVRVALLTALEATLAAGAIDADEARRTGTELLTRKGASSRVAGLRLLQAVGRRHPDAGPAVAQALRDRDRAVRLLACELAGVLVPSGYGPVVDLLSRLAADADRELSRASILALGEVGGPEAAATLRQLRADSDPDVADAARAARARLPDESAEIIPLRPRNGERQPD